ncbi:MAG: helix-turn-helix domain-containing protein [Planctomycetota bacterium]
MSSHLNTENSRNVHGRTVRIKDELYFSPKAVAKALGVSESSLKRWCDAGRIKAIKTAGGHRRLTKADVVAYVKNKKTSLPQPEILGLPSLESVSVMSPEDGAKQLLQAIIEGSEERCRQILIYMYITGWQPHDIFDRVISPAFEHIGRLWQAGQLEVYVERRGCEMCLSVIRELRSLIPAANPGSPIAIGGTPQNDHYSLPSAGVELTLRALGWDARTLGSNLPFNSLVEATVQYRPSLVWLSVSHVDDPHALLAQINAFSTRFNGSPTFVVGGNAINEQMRERIQKAICCSNLSQLVASVGRGTYSSQSYLSSGYQNTGFSGRN